MIITFNQFHSTTYHDSKILLNFQMELVILVTCVYISTKGIHPFIAHQVHLKIYPWVVSFRFVRDYEVVFRKGNEETKLTTAILELVSVKCEGGTPVPLYHVRYPFRGN